MRLRWSFLGGGKHHHPLLVSSGTERLRRNSPLSEVLVHLGVQGDEPQVGQQPQDRARQAHRGHLPPAGRGVVKTPLPYFFFATERLTVVTSGPPRT